MKASQNRAQAPDQVAQQSPVKAAPPGVSWTCTLQRDKVLAEVFVEGVTAGEEFQLQCQGSQIQWAQTPYLEMQEADQFRLVLIQPTKISSMDAALLVASYKIDENAPLGPVYLTDGNTKVLLQGIELKSMSVLPKDKEAKPFGPLGPVSYAWPVWFWIVLALLFLAVISFAWRILRRRNQHRALIKDLEKHSTALLPADQFSKEIRLLRKSYLTTSTTLLTQTDSQKVIHQIERHFLIFISREFSIPAEIWSKSQVIKSTLKQIHFSKNDALKQMAKAFREIEKAKHHVGESTAEDLHQIIEIARVAVQLLAEFHRRKR